MTIANDPDEDYRYQIAAVYPDNPSSIDVYPSAPAVLVDDNDTLNPYADAQIIDVSDTPNHPPPVLAAASATATPIDPWTKNPVQSSLINTLPESNDGNHVTGPSVVVMQTTLPEIEDPLHKKMRRRRRRKTRMIGAGTAGFISGLIFAGPFGAFIVAASGAAMARGACKLSERRKDRRVQRQLVRRQSTSTRETDQPQNSSGQQW